MAALQTTEAVVPGSNPASLTVKNSEDRQSHCVYCKSRGREGDLPLRQKKKKFKKKYFNKIQDFIGGYKSEDMKQRQQKKAQEEA